MIETRTKTKTMTMTMIIMVMMMGSIDNANDEISMLM